MGLTFMKILGEMQYMNLTKPTKLLLSFANTYSCEVGFQCIGCIKSKYWTRVDVTTKSTLSILTPDFDQLQWDALL